MADEIASGAAQHGWLYHPDFTEGWEPTALYSLARWVNGIAFKDIQFSAKGWPVIRIAEIKGGINGQTKFTAQSFNDSVYIRPGDLLFSWSGQPETSIDAFWWRGPAGWLNQHVFKVTPDKNVDTVFFYYLLRYLKPNFIGIARNKQTTGLGHVTRRDLENIVVSLPDPSEQRAIAHILGTLDDRIEANRRMSATLEEMARALFRAWFVTFEPVRAKAEGRWQPGQTLPGLPAVLYDLFPDRLVETERGEVPEGWRLGALSDIASLNPEVWTRATRPASINYVDLANTKWGRIETIQHLAQDEAPSRAQRVLKPGDTIVGTVRPGNGSFAFVATEGLTGSTGFAQLRPKQNRVSALIYLAATAPENIEALAHLADGAAYPAVRSEVVAATRVMIPGREAIEAFDVQAANWLMRTSIAEQESRSLSTLRDSLLPKLVSGAIRVKDTEAFLKERGR